MVLARLLLAVFGLALTGMCQEPVGEDTQVANAPASDVRYSLFVGDPINMRPVPTPFPKSKGRYNRRSTSSSSGERNKDEDSDDEDSLGIKASSRSDSSSGNEKNSKYRPKSTKETHGWHKWHRRCQKCPEMSIKWKDPSIDWICGAYQRARRSFKSACLMRYRNCQDGTMFVKIHSKKCIEDSTNESHPHGRTFFYDYTVKLSEETSKSSDTSVSSDSSSSS